MLDDIVPNDDCPKCSGQGKVKSRFYGLGKIREVEKLCKCVSEQVDKIISLRQSLPKV